MCHFLVLDMTARLGKIICPVLALNGTKDRQVDCEENAASAISIAEAAQAEIVQLSLIHNNL